jgi:DNA-binding response OmpR family regulator
VEEKKILIVDYDSTSLLYLTELFKPYGFKIIKATDGIKAYDKFRSEEPDLVILEAMLPKLHGFDLSKKISEETKGKIPVIIVTGLYRGPQYKSEALKYFGASFYFEKPVNEVKLVESALSLLREGEDIKDELPDHDSIFEQITQRIKGESKIVQEEPVKEDKAETESQVDELALDDDLEKALSDIDVNIVDELSSLLEKKKKKRISKKKQ